MATTRLALRAKGSEGPERLAPNLTRVGMLPQRRLRRHLPSEYTGTQHTVLSETHQVRAAAVPIRKSLHELESASVRGGTVDNPPTRERHQPQHPILRQWVDL